MAPHRVTAALVVLGVFVGVTAGCGASGSPVPGTGDSPAAGTSTPSAGTKTITVSINAGKVTPALGRVEVPQGTTVRIVVNDDASDELHVHGYDKELELPAGKTATLEWVADVPGVFEVETHRTGTVLFQLLVR